MQTIEKKPKGKLTFSNSAYVPTNLDLSEQMSEKEIRSTQDGIYYLCDRLIYCQKIFCHSHSNKSRWTNIACSHLKDVIGHPKYLKCIRMAEKIGLIKVNHRCNNLSVKKYTKSYMLTDKYYDQAWTRRPVNGRVKKYLMGHVKTKQPKPRLSPHSKILFNYLALLTVENLPPELFFDLKLGQQEMVNLTFRTSHYVYL